MWTTGMQHPEGHLYFALALASLFALPEREVGLENEKGLGKDDEEELVLWGFVGCGRIGPKGLTGKTSRPFRTVTKNCLVSLWGRKM